MWTARRTSTVTALEQFVSICVRCPLPPSRAPTHCMHAAIMSSTYEQSVAPIELSAEGCMTLTSPNIPPIAGHPSLEKGKAPVAAQRTPRAALAPKPQFCIVEGCQKPLTSVYLAVSTACLIIHTHLLSPVLSFVPLFPPAVALITLPNF